MPPIEPLDTPFRIGRETLPYVREGLTPETARKVAEIIRRIADVDAVAITDTEQILAYAGAGCWFHEPGRPIQTHATRESIQRGELRVIARKDDFGCPVPGCPCPLQGGVIAPLRVAGRVSGTLKLYRCLSPDIPERTARLALGIAELLSMQLELAEAERQRELATQARLEALQAQIRPHFLFNTLNTILQTSRHDVEKARSLLVCLANFLRRSLSYRGETVALQDEIDAVRTYLFIQEARFGDRIRAELRVAPEVVGWPVPVLTLQPLVENAIVHGLAPKQGQGRLAVGARRRGGELVLLVVDDGVGMDPETLERVWQPGFGSGMGLGLSNVNERLIHMYGPDHALRLRSRPGRGTSVRLRVPAMRPGAQARPAG
jgi:LytS/YehU family sensor histidine kinase